MKSLFYLRYFNQIFLALVLFFGALYVGRAFFIPIAIGALFAMLLVPICRKLEERKLSRLLAASICVLTFIIILAALLAVLINQISGLASDLPRLSQTLALKIEMVQEFIADKFELSRRQQNRYIQDELRISFQHVQAYLTLILMFSSTLLIQFVLVMFLTLMFLLYRGKLKNFIYYFTSRQEKKQDIILVNTSESSSPSIIITEITKVASAYIAGVFTVVFILTVVNTAGLMLMGIEHALFFGLLAGILNIIPYLGSLIGSLVPTLFVLLTKDSLQAPVIVAVFFQLVQLLDNYLLTPNITGARISLNPLATIIGLLWGGFIWGIAGMILFIPFLGIFKVICEHISPLKPYSNLLSNDNDSKNYNYSDDV